MASDELYKLAAEYDKRKLWREIFPNQIFGFKLSDGRIVYCAEQGYDVEHTRLTVYVGAEQFNSCRLNNVTFDKVTENEEFLIAMSETFLQCDFVSKDELGDEDLAVEKSFSKRNKIYFRAKFSHPVFLKSMPLQRSMAVDAADEKILIQALNVAIEVGKFFPEQIPRRINFDTSPPFRRKFPLFVEGKWKMENLPPFRHPSFPEAKLQPETEKKLSAAKKSGSYSCEIFVVPKTEEDKDGIFKYPITLLISDRKSKKFIAVPQTFDYLTNTEKLTANIAEVFLKFGVPKKIFVRNERTFIFLEKFCEQVGIELCEAEELQELYLAEHTVLKRLTKQTLQEEDFLAGVLARIAADDAKNLKESLPPVILELLREMVNEKIFDEDVNEKILAFLMK